MMKNLCKYDLITVAYRSRFLFRTDAEYREALGVSFETVTNNCDSEREISIYYDLLNRECENKTERSLRDVISEYGRASELYLNIDWGERNQMASRKRFCRKLFRYYATLGMKLSIKEDFIFKMKDDDLRLLSVFFPDGIDKEPSVEIAFILLFAFGVIRPWNNADNSRSHDIRDKEIVESLANLRVLIMILREDMPRLGSTEKPLVFQEWIETVDFYLSDEDSIAEASPLLFLTAIREISEVCRMLMDMSERRNYSDAFQGYDMRGLWIDDGDNGETRFWIFPDNFLLAMCFCRKEGGWELTPYDFRVRFDSDTSYGGSFLLMSPKGNLEFTLSPEKIIGDEQYVTGGCECEFDMQTDEIIMVELFENSIGFPKWMNWRKWGRIKPEDNRYHEFRAVLNAVYDPENPHSLFFTNVGAPMTDVINNLVGRDRKYLYIYDWRPGKFKIGEHDLEVFTYECGSNAGKVGDALFELPVSEGHPLYALPIKRMRKKYKSEDANLLADVMADADNIKEVYILHSDRIAHPRLVFPSHGCSVALDMDKLSEAGVRKFTSFKI